MDRKQIRRIRIETQEQESLDLLLHEAIWARQQFERYRNSPLVSDFIKGVLLGEYNSYYSIYQAMCVKHGIKP